MKSSPVVHPTGMSYLYYATDTPQVHILVLVFEFGKLRLRFGIRYLWTKIQAGGLGRPGSGETVVANAKILCPLSDRALVTYLMLLIQRKSDTRG